MGQTSTFEAEYYLSIGRTYGSMRGYNLFIALLGIIAAKHFSAQKF
jgi:hypothetical protein